MIRFRCGCGRSWTDREEQENPAIVCHHSNWPERLIPLLLLVLGLLMLALFWAKVLHP